ncbi:MAG: arsenate reductase family protein [Flavobacteriaceae bacterium]
MKIYHLTTCNTCQRIIKELQPPGNTEYQDIKKQPLTVKQLDEMQRLSGSYESLFSRRAKLYKERGLANESLTEADYKSLILEHYTFLKRPVVLLDDQIFVGNSKKTVEAAKIALHP